MPIGRARDAKELMLTPSQRLKLYRKWEKLLEEKEYLIADFWNSGVLSNGCIAYGRQGGYFYIDWNGNIMPCVFVPYYVDNVKNLFAEGKPLFTSLFSEFFENGRKWQNEYGLGHSSVPDNWLMPCSYRDHYKNFKENIVTAGVKPENEDAKLALESSEYFDMMHAFDSELKTLTDDLWEEEYLEDESDIIEGISAK